MMGIQFYISLLIVCSKMINAGLSVRLFSPQNSPAATLTSVHLSCLPAGLLAGW